MESICCSSPESTFWEMKRDLIESGKKKLEAVQFSAGFPGRMVTQHSGDRRCQACSLALWFLGEQLLMGAVPLSNLGFHRVQMVK